MAGSSLSRHERGARAQNPVYPALTSAANFRVASRSTQVGNVPPVPLRAASTQHSSMSSPAFRANGEAPALAINALAEGGSMFIANAEESTASETQTDRYAPPTIADAHASRRRALLFSELTSSTAPTKTRSATSLDAHKAPAHITDHSRRAALLSTRKCLTFCAAALTSAPFAATQKALATASASDSLDASRALRRAAASNALDTCRITSKSTCNSFWSGGGRRHASNTPLAAYAAQGAIGSVPSFVVNTSFAIETNVFVTSGNRNAQRCTARDTRSPVRCAAADAAEADAPSTEQLVW
mmetsp:Transcript_14612/g.48372  ORF Transcript_14612/g.48372 Transcript_14612/m.48372 type:complete len:300 (-) Transcript_14612:822-1721(-)